MALKRKKATKSGRISLNGQIRQDKSAFVVFVVLRAIVIAVIVRCIWLGEWERCFTGVLSLILFLIPPFVERNFRIKLPTTLEVIVFLFIFCAEILGEIASFYVRVPMWDTMLHTVNGFLFAAVGFSLVDILNENNRFKFELSPKFLVLVAFCFSITIGVLWEFFEFGVDRIFSADMQKDFLIHNIYSVSLDPTTSNRVIAVKNIVQTTIETSVGEKINLAGYLDLGLIDTMKDLIVNFVGAVVFSIVGYFYVKHRGKGKFAKHFIPTYLGNEEHSEMPE